MSKITDFITYFGENHPALELRTNQPMSKFTSFRIGGEAQLMAFPKTEEELCLILKMSKKMDITPVILGAGTNVLAPDEGIQGLVICLKDALGGMEQIGETSIRVMAGVTMSRAANGFFHYRLRKKRQLCFIGNSKRSGQTQG